MNPKQLILTLALMLLSTAAGIFVYQKFVADDTTVKSKQTTPAIAKVDTNNIDLSKLIARNFNGTNVDLSEYEGKHLIINFWATWCPPCRKEIPLLKDVQTKYADQDVQVLGIAMDDTDKVEKYMQAADFNFPSLVSDLNQTTRFGQNLSYQFKALPFTFFINKDGKLIYTKTGELHQDELDKLVQALLSD